MSRKTLDRTIRFFIVIGIMISSLFLLFYIAKITYPFLIAIALALMINPIVQFLETKWRFPRAIAVLSSLVFLIGIFAGLLTLLIAELVASTSYLSKVVPEHVRAFIEYIENFFASQVIPFYNTVSSLLKSLDSGQQETIMNSIRETGSKISDSATTFLQTFFLKLPALVSWIPNAATVIAFALLATFFISKDLEKIKASATRLIPEKVNTSVSRVFVDLRKALVGFVKAQLTLMSITLIIVLIGLLILQVNYAITIALITGLVDLLPYLGTGTIFIPWIIYEVVTGNLGLALGLTILYTVVVVQRQLMEPKILSSNIGVNPLATLISLFVGFKLIGFLGLIIGPVTLVFLTTLQKAQVFHDIWNYIKGTPPEIK